MKTAFTSPLLTASLAASLAGNLVACSQQNWYHGAQSAQTAHCMKQPPAEFNDCNQPSREMTYDEYEKSRQELKIKKDSTDY